MAHRRTFSPWAERKPGPGVGQQRDTWRWTKPALVRPCAKRTRRRPYASGASYRSSRAKAPDSGAVGGKPGPGAGQQARHLAWWGDPALAALSRRLLEIAGELEALDAEGRGDAVGEAAATPDISVLRSWSTATRQSRPFLSPRLDHSWLEPPSVTSWNCDIRAG
jgi:hypothetical protein